MISERWFDVRRFIECVAFVLLSILAGILEFLEFVFNVIVRFVIRFWPYAVLIFFAIWLWKKMIVD